MSCQHMHRSGSATSRLPGARRGERGLTLIELMVGLVVASILVGFVFDIQSRMSRAYRSQSSIGGLQQGLRAASAIMALDVRSAGFMLPDGIRVSSAFPVPGVTTPGLVTNDGLSGIVQPLTVFNNPDLMPGDRMQPDRIHVFYADPYARAVVVSTNPGGTSVVVDSDDNFEDGDLVVFAAGPIREDHPLGPEYPQIITYHSCLVKLTSVGPSLLNFIQNLPDPFNTATNDHCFVPDEPAIVPGAQVFRLVARAYRVDTANPTMAALEVSQTGGLQSDWGIMGVGFVDLQISQRYVEVLSDGIDPDLDSNPRMDWFSAGTPPLAGRHLTQIGIAMVARTSRPVEGVGSASVPVLTDTGAPNNNPLGDAAGPKTITHPEYQGPNDVRHVYRSISTIVDTRNIGIAY